MGHIKSDKQVPFTPWTDTSNQPEGKSSVVHYPLGTTYRSLHFAYSDNTSPKEQSRRPESQSAQESKNGHVHGAPFDGLRQHPPDSDRPMSKQGSDGGAKSGASRSPLQDYAAQYSELDQMVKKRLAEARADQR